MAYDSEFFGGSQYDGTKQLTNFQPPAPAPVNLSDVKTPSSSSYPVADAMNSSGYGSSQVQTPAANTPGAVSNNNLTQMFSGLGGGGGGGGSGKVEFKDNPLNDFSNVAYHIKFYVKGPGGATIIAQSGVTGFNIKELQIDGAAIGPNHRVRNTQENKFVLTITEPMGTSFVGLMYAAGQTASAGHNWLKTRYYIEPSFMGYGYDGSREMKLCGNFPNGGVWTWPVNVNTMETALDVSGGTYVVRCTLANEIPIIEQQLLRIQEDINIEADTVGDFFKKIIEHMNSSMGTKYKGLYNYSVQFHPVGGLDASSFKLKVDSKFNPLQNNSFDKATKETPSGNITKGTAITDLVDNVIGSTEEGQKYMMDKAGRFNQDNPNAQGMYRHSVMWRIYTEVQESQDYNDEYGDFKKTFIFHVKGYQTQATTLNAMETTKPNGSAAMAALNEWRGLAKKYDYIYTGLNTEVIDFDIKFNFAWRKQLPRYEGKGYYTESYQTHAVFNPQSPAAQSTAKNASASGEAALNGPASSLGAAPGSSDTPQPAGTNTASSADAYNGGGHGGDPYSSPVSDANGGANGGGYGGDPYSSAAPTPAQAATNNDAGYFVGGSSAGSAVGNSSFGLNGFVKGSTSASGIGGFNTPDFTATPSSGPATTATGSYGTTGTWQQHAANSRHWRGVLDQQQAEYNAIGTGGSPRTSSATGGAVSTGGGQLQLPSGAGSIVNSIGNSMKNFLGQGGNGSAAGGLQGASYAEDLAASDGGVDPSKVPSATPASMIQTAESARHAVGTGLKAQWHAGKSIYGALLEQIYEPTNSQLNKINLTIKGDPYWIGDDPVSMLTANSGEIVNYTNGDVCFLLTFRYPYSVAENGSPQIRQNDVFTGVYRVTLLTSTFSNGEFKQVLTAVRVPQIRAEDVDKVAEGQAQITAQTIDGTVQGSGVLNPVKTNDPTGLPIKIDPIYSPPKNETPTTSGPV